MTNVAAIQMVSSANLGDNLENADNLISEAVRKKADFVSLPENFSMMGKTTIDNLKIMEEFNKGPIQLFLSNQAKKKCIWLQGGTIPLKSNNPNKTFAASLLYNPEGICIAHYNKIHLFDALLNDETKESYMESASFEPDDKIVVAKTDIGSIGLSICYDLRFPELYRMMHKDKVEIITVPSAFTETTGKVHWKKLLCARAIENLCYVIAPNQGGEHANGRKTWGHSMIIDPWGKVLAKCNQGQGVIVTKIDLKEQKHLRKCFPVLRHRKI